MKMIQNIAKSSAASGISARKRSSASQRGPPHVAFLFADSRSDSLRCSSVRSGHMSDLASPPSTHSMMMPEAT